MLVVLTITITSRAPGPEDDVLEQFIRIHFQWLKSRRLRGQGSIRRPSVETTFAPVSILAA
jgi:hypothetical protein